jgi:hypothetical protein
MLRIPAAPPLAAGLTFFNAISDGSGYLTYRQARFFQKEADLCA